MYFILLSGSIPFIKKNTDEFFENDKIWIFPTRCLKWLKISKSDVKCHFQLKKVKSGFKKAESAFSIFAVFGL